eukprot:1025882-Pelagomonas_calceolata.AAC.1
MACCGICSWTECAQAGYQLDRSVAHLDGMLRHMQLDRVCTGRLPAGHNCRAPGWHAQAYVAGQ